MVKAGLKAIYLSGWQVAGDANLSEQVYPDQSLYPANSVPSVGKLLAYDCSPSFNWTRHLNRNTIARFQQELAGMGYRFQFITLAGFHALNASMFELAHSYAREGMTAYVRLQEHEFELEAQGYTATRHQREVGAGYFGEVATIVSGGAASTLALKGSTEEAQFAPVRV